MSEMINRQELPQSKNLKSCITIHSLDKSLPFWGKNQQSLYKKFKSNNKPANPAHAEEKTITGGACIEKNIKDLFKVFYTTSSYHSIQQP